MSRLSFQEKMLYAQLAGLVVVVVFYAHYLVHSHPGGHWFHALLIGLILLFASFRLILRRGSGNVVQDERDRLIAAMGTRWSNMILWIGLVAMLVMYWDHGGLHSQGHIMDILFHLLLLAAIVRIVRELIAYRMAA
jgi:uncharacterized membrane protein